MTEVRVTINYQKTDRSTGERIRSHSQDELWSTTDYFCPSCGSKSVWARHDGGDYYQGEQFLCSGCGVDWNWPSEPSVSREDSDHQRVDALKAIPI